MKIGKLNEAIEGAETAREELDKTQRAFRTRAGELSGVRSVELRKDVLDSMSVAWRAVDDLMGHLLLRRAAHEQQVSEMEA